MDPAENLRPGMTGSQQTVVTRESHSSLQFRLTESCCVVTLHAETGARRWSITVPVTTASLRRLCAVALDRPRNTNDNNNIVRRRTLLFIGEAEDRLTFNCANRSLIGSVILPSLDLE